MSEQAQLEILLERYPECHVTQRADGVWETRRGHMVSDATDLAGLERAMREQGFLALRGLHI